MDNRTNIGIRIDKGLWYKLRGRAFDETTTAGKLMEKILREYLEEEPPSRQRMTELPEPDTTELAEEKAINKRDHKSGSFRG